MSDWSAGYRTDLDYTTGYYVDQNPCRFEVALLLAGVAPGTWRVGCELGFGNGVSLAIHAAAGGLEWHGTDFLPAHANFARGLTEAAGVAAHLRDDTFEAFCARADLPDFDVIVVHGVWSWVNEANRARIVTFVARKLRPGGVLYLSYNTEAGWAGMLPLRNLMHLHTMRMSVPAVGAATQIDEAMVFAGRVLAASPRFADANPTAARRLEAMSQQGRAYLAHEYFNRDWHPMPFSEVAEALAEARLTYVGPAGLLDMVDGLHLTVPQQEILAAIPDPVLRESARDLMMGQTFRRDLWVKGPMRMSALARMEALDGLVVMLQVHADGLVSTVQGGLGELTLNDEIYRPIVTFLSDHAPRQVREIVALPELASCTRFQVEQAITVLLGKGDLVTVLDEAASSRAQAPTRRLNRAFWQMARDRKDLPILASPVSGGGVRVERLNQLHLAARAAGVQSAEDLARHVFMVLRSQGELLLRDGVAVESDDETMMLLTEGAELFLTRSVPLLEALGIY